MKAACCFAVLALCVALAAGAPVLEAKLNIDAATATGADPTLDPVYTGKGSYTAEALITLPYSGTTEPVKVYYDVAKQRSRSEYYHGMDVYVFQANLNYQFQINPVSDHQVRNKNMCFLTKGDSEDKIGLQSIIPDLTQFTYTGVATARGVSCYEYTRTYTVGDKSNNYVFYISIATGNPVLFEMQGHDDLLGSHYDTYNIIYYNLERSVSQNDTLFHPPNGMSCGDFPGPGFAANRGLLHIHEDHPASETELEAHFADFKETHSKAYESDHEHTQRLANFRHNKRYIENMNRQDLTYTLAVNHMADFHDHEFKMLRGSYSSRPVEEYAFVPENPASAQYPTSKDWRTTGAVTSVKDQGICGSCWSFGTAESIEGQNFLKYNKTDPLSQQALMDCSWGYGNNACDGGEAFRAYEWIMEYGSIPTEASYGVYLSADGYCHPEQAIAGPSLTGYINVTSGDMDTVLTHLANDGPLAVAIDASLKSFNFYASGVYYDPACGNTPDDLDHAVLAVGYGTSSVGGDYWIVKNSWSENYGDQGYILMSRKDNNCGVATDAHLPILA